MITSASNTQIKKLAKLMKKSTLRREEKFFAAEGIKMAAEAIQLQQAYRIYATDQGAAELKKRLGMPCHQPFPCAFEEISKQVLASFSDMVTPQGVIVLARMPEYKEEDILSHKDANLLFLEALRDPGNLGTIFRTAECAGITGIILSEGCVDIYNPKAVRATMGTLFRMPFVYTKDLTGSMEQAKKQGIRIFGAHLKGRQNCYQEDYQGKTAFIIGNEANGMSEQAAQAADILIKIPMAGAAESLNASIAAALLMYEAYRQKYES